MHTDPVHRIPKGSCQCCHAHKQHHFTSCLHLLGCKPSRQPLLRLWCGLARCALQRTGRILAKSSFGAPSNLFVLLAEVLDFYLLQQAPLRVRASRTGNHSGLRQTWHDVVRAFTVWPLAGPGLFHGGRRQHSEVPASRGREGGKRPAERSHK